MSLLDFTVDLDKEEEGVWEDIGEMSFLVAKAGNEKWKKLQRKLETQAFGVRGERKGKNNEKDAEKENEIALTCLAQTAVLDWKNVRATPDGPEIKYSAEKAVEILLDPALKPLTALLLNYAIDQDRFMQEQEEKDRKK